MYFGDTQDVERCLDAVAKERDLIKFVSREILEKVFIDAATVRHGNISMTNKQLLASLLGDNPNRPFYFDELGPLLRHISRDGIYKTVIRLRQSGMNIRVKDRQVTYIPGEVA